MKYSGRPTARASSDLRYSCRCSCGLRRRSSPGSARSRSGCVTARRSAYIAEQPVLARNQRRVARDHVRAVTVQIGDDPPDLDGLDVVAERQALESCEVVSTARRDPRALEARSRAKSSFALTASGATSVERLDPDDRSLRVEVDVRRGHHLAHPSPERRNVGRLHLHALDNSHDVARCHLIADSDGNGDHDGGSTTANDPAVIT